nr:putative capsid protein [Picobirnavirus sp.]
MIVPGISKDGASSLNMVTKKLYTFVRHANSGSRNYDSPDLMNYAFSYISLAVFIEECKRAYRCVMRYSSKNRYLGKALVQSLGFDFENISSNLADFRTLINVAILKFNALKVPDSWPLWGKNYILNSVILKDGDIDRSQLYFYRSTVIWKYNETGTYVGSLTPEYVFGNDQNTILTMSNVKTIFDSILNSFVASEDINIMSGDIMKAYGEDHCFGLDLLSEDSMIDPIYNREMLEVMHNTTIYEVAKSYTTNAGNIIWQDTTDNCLKYDPYLAGNDGYYFGEDNKAGEGVCYGKQVEYLDLFRDDVQPIDTVNASIMTVIPKIPEYLGKDEGYVCQFEDIGTEIAIDGRVFYIDPSASGLIANVATLRRRLFSHYSNMTDVLAFSDSLSKFATSLSKFDWHPRVSYIALNGYSNVSSDGTGMINALYDLYNYTIVSVSDLKKLHDLHVLGGFGLAD